MDQQKLNNIIEFLTELSEDTSTSKNVKSGITEIVTILKSNTEKLIKVNKIHDILDELQDDSNIESFTRTQLWNVMSMIDLL
jgi:uncharacterized protein (UPF0147 family)